MLIYFIGLNLGNIDNEYYFNWIEEDSSEDEFEKLEILVSIYVDY